MRVGPKAEFSVEEPIANSSMLVLPTKDRAGRAQPRDHGGVVGRDEVAEDLRGAGRAHAARQIDVLDGERDAAQRRRVAAREALVGRGGLCERLARADGDEGVEPRLDRRDAVEAGARQLAARRFRAWPDRSLRRGDRQV